MGCQYFEPCDHGAGTFTVAMPKLTFGRGCLSEIGERAQARGFTRVALFTDPTLLSGPYVATVCDSLKKSAIDFEIFSNIRIEPDDRTIIEASLFLVEGNYDSVISVGGGSSIDMGKIESCPS